MNKASRLLIISNMAHFIRNGEIVGHGPTAREISHLASLFASVRHVGCLHSGNAPDLMLPYTSPRVTLVPVPPAGGESAARKLGILKHLAKYVTTIHRELRDADVVHVRCPANIALLAIIQLALRREPRLRWIKYAGNWRPDGREAWSYTFQRWWLRKNFARSRVTVNGRWPDQPGHIHSFYNPCLTDDERAEARTLGAGKTLSEPIRLIFVGQLNAPKGVGRALQVMAELKRRGIPATLDLVGDGPDRRHFEHLAQELGVGAVVRFLGWQPRTALGPLYGTTHLILFPSTSEGWPKVLSEAMAYGVVPLAGAVSSIPQYLSDFSSGRALPPDDTHGFAAAIEWYNQNPEAWRAESANGVAAAPYFTYSAYLERVRELLEL